MKKLFALLLIISLKITAQSWCPLGAEWYFYWQDAFKAPGHIKYNYTGTVTINNKVCQQINAYKIDFSPNLVTTYTSSYNVYTYTDNNVVYLTNSIGTSFDTLYNFNANVGDKWSLTPKNYTCCALSRVNVTATGTQVVQGVTLKWLKVSITGFSAFSNTTTGPFNDTIMERTGAFKYSLFETFPICPYVSDGPQEKSLRCYSDNQILNYKKVSGACNYTYVSLLESKKDNKYFELFPNPTNSKISLSLPQYLTSKIQIINSLGQQIFESTTAQYKLEIDCSNWLSGIYLVYISNNEGKEVVKLIKE
ncbi:MAG: T9SS type A sorting domain-containing protein [Bacteroidetes bacterium]|nr:T9SS type A sorting domain-containing protein [Bacteroidota bacterium]MCA6444929.1 T9SS type A sorting domain-containing protein [Bacteroidota bacterium]